MCGVNVTDLAYELETIESKITENIFLAASESIIVDRQGFLKDLDMECAKIKRAFRYQVVSFENENLVRRYFHFHQESLIDLINTTQGPTRPFEDGDLVESVVVRLSGLLAYLEDHFPEYFDPDLKMPVVTSKILTEEFNSFAEDLSLQLKDSNVDIGLIELIKNEINHELVVGRISFRMFYYLKFLKAGFSNLTLEAGNETFDLIRLLMRWNFNTDNFFNYMVRYIQWSVQKTTAVNEKLEELAFYLKFANQETSLNGIAFNHLDAPVNIQIADWISQEVQYLKHKQQLLPMSLGAEDAVPTDFKLNFDLSVSILAYLFRAFIETGVIQNKNTSELIRFLTKYVKTKRSESISYESLRIKYYSIENGTKDAVKKTLQSILNWINKN